MESINPNEQPDPQTDATPQAVPIAKRLYDTPLGFRVLCIDKASIDAPDGPGFIQLWVMARDYDESLRLAQEYMGPSYVAVIAENAFCLDFNCGNLEIFEENPWATVWEPEI